MSGAHYEAEVERAGINVRIVVDLTEAATYADQDELGETLGQQSVTILRQIERASSQDVPF